MSLQIGQQLGSYQITSLIGKGGMGEVYRARDSKLKRDVAIKILPDEFSLDTGRVSRFQREAESLAALNHQNIAAIHDLQQSDATRFLIMELVEGDTLADILKKRGALPVDEALQIGKQICEALEAAHEKGIIHRDLKPANVKITSNGQVKVLDFGLAKAFEAEATKTSLSQSPTLSLAATNAGVILGTAAYMSPEQAKGRTVDRRTDVFAFGAVLYEMLTARAAFDGEDVQDILGAVLKSEPDWTRLPSVVPLRIRELLRLCLQKDVKKRRQTATDVRIDIEQAVAGPATSTSPPARRARLAWIVAPVVALLIVALGILAMRHLRETPPRETPVVRATILLPENTTVDFTQGVGLPALSPDGRRIVFGARTTDGRTPLWVRSLDGLTAQPLAGTEGATFPFWSPDSGFIGFFADGKLKKIDAAGGPALPLTDAVLGRGGSWSRNGVIVFSPGPNASLLRVSSAGGASSPVSTEPGGAFPWFLPNGQHFVYQGAAPDAPRLPIRVGSVDGSPSKAVGEAGSNALYAQGQLLFLREGTLMAQPFDAESLATTGEAVPLAGHVQSVLNSGRVGAFSVSETGLVAYRESVGGRGTVLTWFDRSGKPGTPVGDQAAFLEYQFSRDQKSVAATLQGNGPNADDIWIYDVSRGVPTRFTFDTADDESSVWSPDGRSIVFRSNRKGRYDLYRKAVDSIGTEELLYADDSDKTPTDWSADGKLLLYTSFGPNSKTGQDVWVLPVTPETPGVALKPFVVLQTAFTERAARFSPDGRWIVYISNESQRDEVYVTPFPPPASRPGGKRQISVTGVASFPGAAVRWRQDSREIFYVSQDQRLMTAEVAIKDGSLEVRTVRPLFDLQFQSFDVSADGQRFLVRAAPEQQSAEPLTLIQNWLAALRK